MLADCSPGARDSLNHSPAATRQRRDIETLLEGALIAATWRRPEITTILGLPFPQPLPRWWTVLERMSVPLWDTPRDLPRGPTPRRSRRGEDRRPRRRTLAGASPVVATNRRYPGHSRMDPERWGRAREISPMPRFGCMLAA